MIATHPYDVFDVRQDGGERFVGAFESESEAEAACAALRAAGDASAFVRPHPPTDDGARADRQAA